MWKRWKVLSLSACIPRLEEEHHFMRVHAREFYYRISEEEKRKYVEETDLKQFADGTIVDKEQLIEVLQMAKKEGHTISYSELENHTAAIAAPIFASDGTIVAGISISGLAIEYNETNIAYFIAKVKETAHRISKEIGFLA